MQRIAALVVVDIVLQVVVIVVGLAVFFQRDPITDSIHLGETPTWGNAIFAVGVATVVFTGLESASGLSGEVRVGRRGLERLIASATISVLVLYVGIGRGRDVGAPGRRERDLAGAQLPQRPMVGVAEAFHPRWSPTR